MKNTKRILAAVLSAAAVTTLSLPAWAAEATPVPISADVSAPVSGKEKTLPYYMSYTGKVTSVTKSETMEGVVTLGMESEEQGPANPSVTADTLIIGEKEISVGDTVTIFYESDRPMIMIYPPQYTAGIAIVNPKADMMITADLFDENLLSRGGDLVLTIGDDTELLGPDGAIFEGTVAGNRLLVFYTVVRESFPAQTTPERVIVLGAPETEDIAVPEDSTETEPYTAHIDTADIVVEGKIIEAPRAFVGEGEVVMVPLRAVAEALGYDVVWEADTQTVRLNTAISLSIGRDYYVYMRMAPIELGTAPVLKDGRTFVPISYFTKVLNMNNAYFFENQVVIDNQEKME